MYISKLSLYGFKSFPRKSEIKFGKGITSVVGPNGCGKTNIVDAIRWVIGEQKSSVLRADRNTDVIFNGTTNRRPLNLAEVSLTIQNVSGRISLPYSDIVITRRIYRNGESEYFINKNLCRLKDITDLFIDTGMGANAYSIIELKMIEDILSETPEERKRLFEEAAGVNKYRVQRRAAFRKLEATKDDLLRLNDIITEVEAKVKHLRRQLRRYEKHQEVTQKLIRAEVDLAARKVRDIKIQQEPIDKQLKSHRQELQKVVSGLKEQEALWQQKHTDFEEREKILETKNRHIDQLREERTRYQTEELVLKEQNRNINQSIDRLAKELDSLERQIAQNEERSVRLKEEEDQLQRELEQKREEFQKFEADNESVEKEYQQLTDNLQKLQDEKFNLVKQKAADDARYTSLSENIRQREAELQQLQSRLQQQEQKAGETFRALEERKNTLQSISKQLEELQARQAGTEEQYLQLVDREKESQEQKRSLQSRLDQLDNKIQFYSGIIESREGFSPGLQYVLDRPGEFGGIRGALSDLLSVEPEYYLAVEAVIKDISRLLVADDRQAALAALKKLGAAQKGRVSIIPLDADFQSANTQNLSHPKLTPLTGYIRCDQSVDKLKTFLFQNIYCCRDADFEACLENPELGSVSLVSDQGRLRDAFGIYSGGSAASDSNIFIGRRQRLQQYEKEADKVRKNLDDQLAQLKSVQDKLNQTQQTKREIAKTITDKEQELENQRSRLRESERELFECRSAQKQLEDNRVSLQVAITNFKERLQQKDPAAARGQRQIEALDTEIEALRAQAAKLKEGLDRIIDERQNRRISLIQLENRFRNNRDNQEMIRRNLESRRTARESNLAEKKEHEATREALQTRIKQNGAKLTEAQQKVTEYEAELDEFRQSYQQLRSEIQRLNEELFKLRHRKETLSEKVAEAELDQSQLESGIREIQSVLQEKYNQTLPEQLDEEELPSLEDARKRVERYKRNLELIGMVNMTVKEEYEEEHSRLTFLKEQREDLIKSEKGLNEVIRKIDKIARDQYFEIFEKIRKNFQATFAVFFGGGEADLKLVGDPDPLEAQIEIYACPRGKKMRSLKMLSAGEKALTAIALLFGIYQVKPSPFCILDEVDAPLDDENTRRFTNVIRSFSENTQFIIVTHNKSTMEIADAMYGVTMAESGISQIVSVKME